MVRAHAVQIRHGNRSPSRLFAKIFKSFLTSVAFSRADTLEMSSWQLPNLILPNPPPPPLLRRRHRTESIRQRSYKGTDEISVSRSQCMNIQRVYKLDLPTKFLFCKKPVDTYSLYYALLIKDCGVFTCYLLFNCASMSLWWAKNYLWIREHNIVLRASKQVFDLSCSECSRAAVIYIFDVKQLKVRESNPRWVLAYLDWDPNGRTQLKHQWRFSS